MRVFNIVYLIFVIVSICCAVMAFHEDDNVVKTDSEREEKYKSDYVDMTFLNGL